MTTAAPTERPRRRTQAERRAETRAALLDATVECLVTYGYAKTTTGRIAELAGVSRGAQIPYFRNRAELVGAAVAHLAERRIQAVHERFAGNRITLEEGLDALWDECQGPIFDAALELWVASRTDPELRENLMRMERTVVAAVVREAQAALGSAASHPDFTENLSFALAAIRGLALLRVSNGWSSRALAKRWRQTRERLVRIFPRIDS
jgi:AcrR family transcriptional regulator